MTHSYKRGNGNNRFSSIGNITIMNGLKLDYASAFNELAKMQRKLPSMIDHDTVLSSIGKMTPKELKIASNYYPAWQNEILVYPEQNGRFSLHVDVTDSSSSDKPWVLLSKYVPGEVINRRNIGLLVIPKNIIDEKRWIIVEPASIFVIESFMQTSGMGPIDEKTRIPVQQVQGQNPSNANTRRLWRTEGIGVRPITRDMNGNMTLFARVSPEMKAGVGYVDSGTQKPVSKGKTHNGTGNDQLRFSINGITENEFRTLHGNATKAVQYLRSIVTYEGLRSAEVLLEKLKLIPNQNPKSGVVITANDVTHIEFYGLHRDATFVVDDLERAIKLNGLKDLHTVLNLLRK